jgi:hypothetical protein
VVGGGAEEKKWRGLAIEVRAGAVALVGHHVIVELGQVKDILKTEFTSHSYSMIHSSILISSWTYIEGHEGMTRLFRV